MLYFPSYQQPLNPKLRDSPTDSAVDSLPTSCYFVQKFILLIKYTIIMEEEEIISPLVT